MKKIVIAGLGFMGVMHAQVYKQLKNAALVGVIDLRKEATLNRLAELGMGGIPVYTTFEEALAGEAFDVLDVCLPTDLHLKMALKGIAAGKALFCEKPLALSNEETAELCNAAKQAGTPVQVGQCIRFWPEYQALRAFHTSGEGGKLLNLTLTRRSARPSYADGDWLNKPERSKGAAFDLHIHDTDFVLALLGQPKSVSSEATFDFSGPCHIFTRYCFDGPIVQAEGGWNYPDKWGFQMAFQAVYEKAVIDYDSNAATTLAITRPGKDKAPMPFVKTGGQSAVSEGNISDLGGYHNELASFIDHLEAGKAITDATAEQAALSVKIALAEIESARTGKTIAII